LFLEGESLLKNSQAEEARLVPHRAGVEAENAKSTSPHLPFLPAVPELTWSS
jgi:hypothetical protein